MGCTRKENGEFHLIFPLGWTDVVVSFSSPSQPQKHAQALHTVLAYTFSSKCRRFSIHAKSCGKNATIGAETVQHRNRCQFSDRRARIRVETVQVACGMQVYVVIRPTKRQTAQQRLYKMFESSLFRKLTSSSSALFQKVQAVAGDITAPGLGFSPSDRASLAR